MKSVHIPHLNRSVVLVPREQLRRKSHGRTLRLPLHLRGLMAQAPTAPASFDGSKGRTVKYDILGNDRYGDCYEADALHCSQTWCVNAGKAEPVFDVAAVVKEYLALSGGDNGLGDDQVFPHWKNPGFQGHKILDDMTVDPRDDAAIRLGLSLFCGGSYTAALADKWLDGAAPGAVWDAATPDQANGHAMHLSGYDGSYYYVETWGFDRAIRLTPRGLKGSDPETTIQFSLEMFNAQGIAPHNGMSYDQLAALWAQLGGATLPPSPFGPPTPVPPAPTPPPVPVPPTPGRYLYTTLYKHAVPKNGWVNGFPAPVDVPKGSTGKIYAPSGADGTPGEEIVAVVFE